MNITDKESCVLTNTIYRGYKVYKKDNKLYIDNGFLGLSFIGYEYME